MRLYTHDLQFVPVVPLQPGDSIEALERSRSEILRDIYPVDLEEDQARLDQEQKCFVGWSSGRAAHFSWVQDTGVHELRGTWRRDAIQPGDFWIYSCRTADWARGRRLYPAALVAILRTYKSLNYRRALISVAEENEASINGIDRAGFVLAERIKSFALRSSLYPLPGSSYRKRGAWSQ
jgi:RimJ/RimL family protein N-acetyltransferase